MNIYQLIPLKFCKDFGDFIQSIYHVEWPSLPVKDLADVPQMFTTEVGFASIDKTITRHKDIYVDDIGFVYERFLHKRKAHAILYVKHHAAKIKNASIFSFFIMCSFIGSVCVYCVQHGNPESAQLPLIAMADILHDGRFCDVKQWNWINEVAALFNRRPVNFPIIETEEEEVTSAEELQNSLKQKMLQN